MIYFLIEFLDELVFGVTDAAWPFIQAELGLNYTQIGILLTVPGIFSIIVEPFLGILGDVWKRRLLILGGGICFVLALLLTSLSVSFLLLLFAFCLFYPASGAFVSLSQATLMDRDPARHDQDMARWTFAGSLGVALGPPLLVGLSALGFGWRGVFLALTFLAGFILILAWRRIPRDAARLPKVPPVADLFAGFRDAIAAIKLPGVFRWLVLLEFSDLMLDVLLGFLALYFHDVAGLTATEAAGAVFIWLVVGLLGDLLLIPLLERMDGLAYLRVSVLLELALFPAFLLAPQAWLKLVLVGLLGFFNSGWYAILKGRLYSAIPGKSGTVMALDNLTGIVGGLLPLGIGLAADAFGLEIAVWFLLAGPIALLLGLPRKANNR
ncbi:MAG: MFS transporter [Chloroflexi bacterium]|nr:MFS transporter [Chloroflexota bacterium]